MTTGSAAIIDVPTAGTYQMDAERSTVAYSGRHMFGLGTVHATFTIRSGQLRVADHVSDSNVTVTVDAASFRSNSAKRDKDVRSASLLDVATYPDVTFASDGLRQTGDGWVFTGAVRAHGNSVPVEVLIDRVMRDSEGIRVHARAEHLDRYAFGVIKSKGMVGRYLDLDLDVFAVPV